jgi:hypothetical protein
MVKGESMVSNTEEIVLARVSSVLRKVGSSVGLLVYRVVVRPGICICDASDFVNRFGGRWC